MERARREPSGHRLSLAGLPHVRGARKGTYDGPAERTMSDQAPATYYDALASRYHLLFDDWWAAARWHGEVIAGILASRGFAEGRLLDCTCGVGTQALP